MKNCEQLLMSYIVYKVFVVYIGYNFALVFRLFTGSKREATGIVICDHSCFVRLPSSRPTWRVMRNNLELQDRKCKKPLLMIRMTVQFPPEEKIAQNENTCFECGEHNANRNALQCSRGA